MAKNKTTEKVKLLLTVMGVGLVISLCFVFSEKNVTACENYYNVPCSRADPMSLFEIKFKCICGDQEMILTQEMIDKRNAGAWGLVVADDLKVEGER